MTLIVDGTCLQNVTTEGMTHNVPSYLVFRGPLEGVLLRMELRSPDGDAPLGLDQRDELHAVVVHVGRQSFPK